MISRWGLALAHADARELTIAAAHFQAALMDAEQSCGRQHPQTIALRADLARCHDTLGQTEAARDGLRRALADSIRSLGGDHDETTTLREELNELEAHHPVRTVRWVPT